MRETADIETSSDGYASRFSGPVGRWMLGSVAEKVLRNAPKPVFLVRCPEG